MGRPTGLPGETVPLSFTGNQSEDLIVETSLENLAHLISNCRLNIGSKICLFIEGVNLINAPWVPTITRGHAEEEIKNERVIARSKE